VHEHAAADLDGDRPPAQPAAVGAARPKRLAVLDAARRIGRHPGLLSAVVGGRRLVGPGAGAGFDQALVLAPAALAGFRGLAVGEGGADLGRGVAQVAEQVHHLVIAEHLLDAPFRLRGVALEGHHHVQHAAHLGAAIGEVPGLDEGGGATGPALAVVAEAGRLQDRGQAGQAAMDVADGDDPRRSVAVA
jgi:hypothetical protein